MEGRYTPILPERKIGICFLKDSKPGAPDEYLALSHLNPPQELTHTTSAPVKEASAEHQENMPESFEFGDEEQKALRKNEES